MGFRQNNRPKAKWKEWRQRHQAELEQCGLPGTVLESEEHWWDFLMHGYLDHHDDATEFSVDALSKAQAECLKQFLERTLSEEDKMSAIVLAQIKSRKSV